MQIVTDPCRLRGTWIVLLHFVVRNPRDEIIFYGPFGVNMGRSAGHGGVGFEPVLFIGSQRFDGAM